MRANIVVAVGAMGSEEDLQKFMELCRADFEHRVTRIAANIMRGRVTILPLEESLATESEDDGGAGDGGDEGEVREDRVALHGVREEPPSEEAEPQDEPGFSPFKDDEGRYEAP